MKYNHLILFCILAISLLHSAAPTPVYDTDGDELTANTSYFVLPAGRERSGGGLMLSPHGLPCPLFVGQDSREGHSGLPVQFTSRGAVADQAIRTSGDVHIHFANATACVQSTKWHLGRAEPVHGYRHVLTGPPMFDPKADAFKIKEHGDAAREYKLVSCGDVACKDLSVFEEEGKRWLGISESGLVLMVMLQKA